MLSLSKCNSPEAAFSLSVCLCIKYIQEAVSTFGFDAYMIVKVVISMHVQIFEIPDVALVTPRRFEDSRGYFVETWSDRLFREKVADVGFVQDNQSLTRHKGTIRGLHYQRPPAAQGKLVRVLQGSILDVAVDVREGSPTFGKHVAVRLDAMDGAQLWVPEGFLHGFCTLEDNTEVAYKVTSYYSAEHDAGIAFDDPALAIDWPVSAADVVLSDKDRHLPKLSEQAVLFTYQTPAL